jgi:hypothetical protein
VWPGRAQKPAVDGRRSRDAPAQGAGHGRDQQGAPPDRPAVGADGIDSATTSERVCEVPSRVETGGLDGPFSPVLRGLRRT